MADPKRIVIPDDTQREFARMQRTFAFDLRALFETEQEEVLATLERAAVEGWSADKLNEELAKIVE